MRQIQVPEFIHEPVLPASRHAGCEMGADSASSHQRTDKEIIKCLQKVNIVRALSSQKQEQFKFSSIDKYKFSQLGAITVAIFALSVASSVLKTCRGLETTVHGH